MFSNRHPTRIPCRHRATSYGLTTSSWHTLRVGWLQVPCRVTTFEWPQRWCRQRVLSLEHPAEWLPLSDHRGGAGSVCSAGSALQSDYLWVATEVVQAACAQLQVLQQRLYVVTTLPEQVVQHRHRVAHKQLEEQTTVLKRNIFMKDVLIAQTRT